MQIEIWVVVDQDGDYEVGKADGDAVQNYFDNVTDDSDSLASVRKIKLTVEVDNPCRPIELRGKISLPAESGLIAAAAK